MLWCNPNPKAWWGDASELRWCTQPLCEPYRVFLGDATLWRAWISGVKADFKLQESCLSHVNPGVRVQCWIAKRVAKGKVVHDAAFGPLASTEVC